MKLALIYILFLTGNLIACAADTECFVADSVSQVKVINAEAVDYFIYLRITGLHEKEAFYELYTQEPLFDDCGKSATLASSDIHIDAKRGKISKLLIDNRKMSITYTKGDTTEADYKNVIVEVK